MPDIAGKLFPNLTTLIVQLLSTGVLLIIFKKFLWNYVMQYFSKRADYIESTIQDANTMNEEASKNLEIAEKQAREAAAKYREIVDLAKEDGQKIKQQIVDEANVEAKAKIESLRNDYTSKKLTLDAMRNAAKNPAASGYVAGDLMLEKTEQYAQALGVKYENILEVFRSEKNKASELLETEVDYQFYVVLEKYNAKMLGLSDVVTPGSTVTVYEYIKANITNQKKSAALLKAVQDISRELNVPANVERKKTGAELDALLSW